MRQNFNSVLPARSACLTGDFSRFHSPVTSQVRRADGFSQPCRCSASLLSHLHALLIHSKLYREFRTCSQLESVHFGPTNKDLSWLGDADVCRCRWLVPVRRQSWSPSAWARVQCCRTGWVIVLPNERVLNPLVSSTLSAPGLLVVSRISVLHTPPWQNLVNLVGFFVPCKGKASLDVLGSSCCLSSPDLTFRSSTQIKPSLLKIVCVMFLTPKG